MNSISRTSAALAAIVLSLCAVAFAADWAQPATKLAREIVAISGPGAASISYRNQSSLSVADEDIARKALERQLRSNGVRLSSPENASADIRITFSENADGYIWIAEVQQGSDTRVAMVTADRPPNASPVATPASLTVHKTLLWSQPAPILDLAVVPAGSDQIMLVLDPEGVTLFKHPGGTWLAQQTLVINHDRAWPRDLVAASFPAAITYSTPICPASSVPAPPPVR